MPAPPLTVATPRGPTPDARSVAIADMGRAVGFELLQRYLIAFEVAGLLLTAALVGAIALAHSEETEIVPRLGPSADRRGETTEEPAIGLASKADPAHLTGGAAAALTSAKLAPDGEAHAS